LQDVQKEKNSNKQESLARLQDSLDQLAQASMPLIRAGEEQIQIQADSTVYTGNVSIIHNNSQMDALKVTLDKQKNQIFAKDIVFSMPEKHLRITGKSATYDLAGGILTINGNPQLSTETRPFYPVNHVGVNLRTGNIDIAANKPVPGNESSR
jgi:lipopolysaccharide assembly outer membrane protein LptD (OstA)